MKTLNLIMLLLLFSFFSCKEGKKEHVASLVKEWQGKEIIFPSKAVFTRYATDTVNYLIQKSNYKILVYVDSLGCTSCKLQLSKWKEFMTKVDSVTGGTVQILFFFQLSNYKEIKYLLKRDGFSAPICIDKNDELNKLNRFPSKLAFQTFLLDGQNHVKVIGNPIHNLAVRDLYLKVLTDGRLIAINREKTTVSVSEIEKDLGSFSKSEIKETVFTISNTGNHALLVKGVTTSCDCTTASTDRRQVPPKGELKLTLHYKPDRKGDFLRTVSLYSNAKNSPTILTITGNVR